MGWHTAKDAVLPLKYIGLINAVMACPMCSKQGPRPQPKESRAVHWSSQLVRDWPVDYIGPLPLGEGSKYAWICVDTVSSLTQAFPCCCTNQAATIRGLEKLSTMYGYHYRISNDWGSRFKGHDMQRAENMTLDGAFIPSVTYKQQG